MRTRSRERSAYPLRVFDGVARRGRRCAAMTKRSRPTKQTLAYLSRLPATIPPDVVLVHNRVRPTRRLGSRGFRAWLSRPDAPRLRVCDCGFAPELGRHFTTAPIDDSDN